MDVKSKQRILQKISWQNILKVFSSKFFLLIVLLIVLPTVGVLLLECQGNTITNLSINRLYYNGSNNPIVSQIIERHYATISLSASFQSCTNSKNKSKSKSKCKESKECRNQSRSGSKLLKRCKSLGNCNCISLGDYIFVSLGNYPEVYSKLSRLHRKDYRKDWKKSSKRSQSWIMS